MKNTTKSAFLRYFLLIILTLITQQISAELSEKVSRIWTSKSGTQLDAQFVSHDEKSVTLKRNDNGKPLTFKICQLSKEDQKFIATLPEEFEEKGETAIAGIDAQPGKISAEIKCIKSPKWSYFIYLPQQFHAGKKWPVWFITSARGGRGGRDLNRYRKGADRLGCILALSVQSKNDFADSDDAMEAMADDVYERLPVIEKLGFSTGMSGGSRMAYLLAERNKNISGILACGSGRGIYLKEKDFRKSKLRPSTYVYSLIGTNGFNRSEAVTTHNTFPKHFRLRFFPGQHTWAGSPYIEEGMARVLGEALARSKNRDLEKLKKQYAAIMWPWILELKEKQPWEAVGLAELLSQFDANRSVQDKVKKLASALNRDPQVILAKQADKDIHQFCQKYYNRFISLGEGKKPNPKREAKAEKLARKYEGLPHATLLRRLGKPS